MIHNSELRNGRFTSSEINRLCKTKGDTLWKLYKDDATYQKGTRSTKNFDNEEQAKKAHKSMEGSILIKVGPEIPQSFYNYVDEVFIERQIGRSSTTEVKTQSMKWGKLMEVVLFNLLGMEYTMAHKSTRLHPKYGDVWSGTPDLIVPKVKTGEIKCFEPLHFGKLSLALLSEDTETVKQKESEAYWQAISNSLICGVDKAEIIAYMPYKSELEEIIQQVEETNFLERNNLDPTDYYFLTQENIESLPHLPDDSKFSNINTFEFEIPKDDKEFLIERVFKGKEELKKLSF